MENILNLAARRFPSPRTVGLPLRIAPGHLRQSLLANALSRHLRQRVSSDEIGMLEGKAVRIRMSDIDCDWWLEFRDARLVASSPQASPAAVICGGLGDFLMLAGRLEDPDTLFFERRLEVSGDTATGLLLRNLLDRMPADALPLPQRIILNRAARFCARLRRLRPA